MERGPHHRVWERIEYEPAPDGRQVPRPHRYVELATGMHYWSDGQWKESQELIEAYLGGAVARHGQHKVIFAYNLATLGAIDMELPDGNRLRSHVLGLSYFDTASGKNVLIAGVKDCTGVIVEPNQVLYADAFEGLRADVRYTYTRAGFEQDIILHERPLGPEAYGLDPATTRLQVWTEFVQGPKPVKARRAVQLAKGHQVADETLDFGSMQIGTGKAFTLGEGSDPASGGPRRRAGEAARLEALQPGRGVPVGKQWLELEGRRFLVEEVPVDAVAEELESLPVTTAPIAKAKPVSTAQLVLSLPVLPSRTGQAESAANPMELASAGSVSLPDSALVLDYIILNSSMTNYTFRGDTTYYISGPVNLYGTNILEGGAVLKYTNRPSATMSLYGHLVCQTGPYRPAVFTSMHDDSVGEMIAYSTGSPSASSYGTALNFQSSLSQTLSNIRIAYAGTALAFAYTRATVSDAQFVNCGRGVYVVYECNVAFQNALFSSMEDCAFEMNATYSVNGNEISAANVTFDRIRVLCLAYGPDYYRNRLFAYNCIFANITNLMEETGAYVWGSHNGFYNSPQFGANRFTSPVYPFQSSGGGHYYLVPDGPFRNVGMASPGGVAASQFLKNKTTQPPIDFPRFYEIKGELALFPYVRRYTAGPPDLGYHYDALDYTVAALLLKGGKVTVYPGTAVGFREEFSPGEEWWWNWWWTLIGINFLDDASFVSKGTPTQRNVFADVQNVQEAVEGPTLAMFVLNPLYFLDSAWGQPWEPSSLPECKFEFSDFYPAANWFIFAVGHGALTYGPGVELTLENCCLYNGWVLVWPLWDLGYPNGHVICKNNLFRRTKFDFESGTSEEPVTTIEMRNNLFYGGALGLWPTPEESANWTFTDNLFDKVAFGQGGPVQHDYNGYWLRPYEEWEPWECDYYGWCCNHLIADLSNWDLYAPHDVILTAAPRYTKGPFGDFYFPVNSSTYLALRNAGSRTYAEAGLAHYTIRLDQVKEMDETSDVVNIGLHFVATAGPNSTQPKDTDGDGIPDYVEDSNGNGQCDLGETDCQTPQTEPGIPDPVNTVYDDVDLDGDGMVGRVEKALSNNLLVSDNPLTLAQVNEEAPGIFTFKVPLSYNVVASMGSLTLRVDGEDPFLQGFEQAADGNCLLVWNTTYESPGQHYLAVELNTAEIQRRGASIVNFAQGPILPFFSQNLMQFDEANAQYDDNGATLYAKLLGPSASYTIELLDPANPSGPPIKTITGTTSTGEIEEQWDLTYDDGITVFTGDDVIARFTVTFPNGASQTLTQWLFKVVRPYLPPPIGNFTVAYAWHNDSEAQPASGALRRNMQYAVVDVLMAPRWFWQVYRSTFNRFSEGLDPGYPGYLPDRATVISNLVPDLALDATRNFFFEGHGHPKMLSDGKWPQPVAYMTTADVRAALGNTYSVRTGAKIRHPYRFVFLDACTTAKTREWQRAFGIRDRVRESQLSRVGPQAFVGWRDPIPIPPSWDDYGETLAVFHAAWMLGYPLAECLRMASDRNTTNPLSGRQLRLPLPVWKNRDLWPDPLTGKPRYGRLRVSGYLGITAYGYVPGY